MIYKLTSNPIEINIKETLRYLGYQKNSIPEGEVEKLLKECAPQVYAEQSLAACYSVYDLSVWGDELDLGFARVVSHSLAINLAGCKKIVLFAATAGAGIDRLIAKYARLSPARAAIVQAMGAALAEDWCDELCRQFEHKYGRLKPRFSCGYGDLDIGLQRDIFAALCVNKHIGITLSDDMFMTPTKSVTAIVGIEDELKG